jgi:hypothetical protein
MFLLYVQCRKGGISASSAAASLPWAAMNSCALESIDARLRRGDLSRFCPSESLSIKAKSHPFGATFSFCWGGGIRTPECMDQNHVPYHLATPQYNFQSLFNLPQYKRKIKVF